MAREHLLNLRISVKTKLIIHQGSSHSLLFCYFITSPFGGIDFLFQFISTHVSSLLQITVTLWFNSNVSIIPIL